jgi:nicotinamidase/pyrazinamidase
MQKPGNDDLLLIIDVQNDFCSGGALAVGDGDAAVVSRLGERYCARSAGCAIKPIVAS